MPLPRVTISGLSIAVAVVAVNLAVVRWVYPAGWETTLGAALSGMTLQAALFGLVRKQGRAFRVGFIVGEILAVLTSVPPLSRPPEGTLLPTGAASYLFVEQAPASPCWNAWFLYSRFVFRYLPAWQTSSTAGAVVWFVPVLLSALSGGLLARRFSGVWRRGRGPGARRAVPPGHEMI